MGKKEFVDLSGRGRRRSSLKIRGPVKQHMSRISDSKGITGLGEDLIEKKRAEGPNEERSVEDWLEKGAGVEIRTTGK